MYVEIQNTYTTMNTIGQKLRELVDLVDQLQGQQEQQGKQGQHEMFDRGLYFNSKQSVSIYEDVISRVTDCLKIAEKYGGKVFGGYVRNVVVPRLCGDDKVIGYKDVDIWFETEDGAQSFVTDMGDRMKKLCENGKTISNVEVYPFSRVQYLLIGQSLDSTIGKIDGASDGIILDIIVSKTLPVNDLNVNQLTYSPSKGLKSYGKETTFELISAIFRKEAYMLKDYPMRNGMQNLQYKRLDRLFSGGWKITNHKCEIYNSYSPQIWN